MTESETPISHLARQMIFRSVPEGFLFGKVTANGITRSRLRLFAKVDFPSRFEAYLADNNWANRTDLKVTLIEHTDRFLLAPVPFSDDDTVRACFRFQFGDDSDQQIYTAPMEDDKQTFCWEIESARDLVFERVFPNLTVWSTAYILANWTANQAKDTEADILVAHFHGHQMHLFVARPDRLVFANAFTVRSSEEITYFLLRVIEQLNLEPTTLQAFLCSETLPFSELEKLLSPYLANLIEAEFTLHPDRFFQVKVTEPQTDME